MTDPNNSFLNNEAESEDTADNALPDNAALQSQSVSNAVTQLQPIPTTMSARISILSLPPEVRLIIFRHLLQLPYHIPYNLPTLWDDPNLQSRAGILYTSALFHSEAINVFYRENTFFLQTWFATFVMVPSQRIGDMIQNLAFDIRVSAALQGPRDQFINIVHNFGGPAIIRGTLNVRFLLYIGPHLSRDPLDFFVRILGRFTNFRVVEVSFFHRHNRTLSTATQCDLVENDLRFVLGPARHCTNGHGLTFLPQQFLNEQLSQNNFDWMHLLDGLRLDWDGDETTADQSAEKSEPRAQYPSSEG